MDGKRRLPPWMVGVSAANKVDKSLDVEVEDKMSVGTDFSQSKSKGRTRRRKEETMEVEASSFLVKCERKRRKRGVVEEYEVDCDVSMQENGVEKRKHGRVGREVIAPDPLGKKQVKSSGFESSNKIEAPCPDEDDEDLTMEDMLSIAKEFVKEDNDVGQKKPSEQKCITNSEFACTTSSRRETRFSPIVVPDARSPTHEVATSPHNSTENMTNEVTLADSKMTGDPAQDMLDLFLGPLLKKSVGKDEKVRLVSEDMILPHKVKEPKQDPIVSNKPLVLTKKKSSLRDKVAMLLD